MWTYLCVSQLTAFNEPARCTVYYNFYVYHAALCGDQRGWPPKYSIGWSTLYWNVSKSQPSYWFGPVILAWRPYYPYVVSAPCMLCCCHFIYTSWVKKVHHRVFLSQLCQVLTDFLKFFHWYTLWEICNIAIIKFSTSPQICCCTTLWNINVKNQLK